MHVDNLCRICLTEVTSDEDTQPLFDEDNESCTDLVQKIEQCCGVLLKPYDEFPKIICVQCVKTLDVSHRFRTMCQSSETALLESCVKPEELIIESTSKENEDCVIVTEFVNAEEEHFSDIEENSTEFIMTDDDKSDIEFLVDEGELDYKDEDYVVNELEDNSDDDYKETKVSISKKRVTQKVGRPTKKEKLEMGEREPPKKRGRKKKISSENPSIMCEICGNIYNKPSSLKMHMVRHLDRKPFQCEICSKPFASQSDIRRHMRVHTGERPYVCSFCGRTFTDRSTHIRHKRTHTNERPFRCNTCGKSFSYANVLKNHTLTHTGEKPFSCIPCNKTFSRKHQLDQHLSTLTHQHTVRNVSGIELLQLQEED